MNANHARRLLATLAYVDRLLEEAEHLVASSSSRGLFPRVVVDIPPRQARALAEAIAGCRRTMLRHLRQLDLEAKPPTASLRHTLKVQFTSAEIALEDVRPRALRGYGELSAEEAEAIAKVIGDLHGAIERLRTLLAPLPAATRPRFSCRERSMRGATRHLRAPRPRFQRPQG